VLLNPPHQRGCLHYSNIRPVSTVGQSPTVLLKWKEVNSVQIFAQQYRDDPCPKIQLSRLRSEPAYYRLLAIRGMKGRRGYCEMLVNYVRGQ
jgi:hypothetical protein